MDEGSRLLRDGLFVGTVDGPALYKGKIVVRVFVEYGTAIAAAQQILPLEFFEVPADGFFGDIEEAAQIGNVDLAVLDQALHDFSTSFYTQHVFISCVLE